MLIIITLYQSIYIYIPLLKKNINWINAVSELTFVFAFDGRSDNGLGLKRIPARSLHVSSFNLHLKYIFFPRRLHGLDISQRGFKIPLYNRLSQYHSISYQNWLLIFYCSRNPRRCGIKLNRNVRARTRHIY